MTNGARTRVLTCLLLAVTAALLAAGQAGAIGQRFQLVVRGHGQVTDNSPQLDCRTPASFSDTSEHLCKVADGSLPTFISGSVVTLTATVLDSADGWRFVGWQGDACCGSVQPVDCFGGNSSHFHSGLSCTFVMNIWESLVYAIFDDAAAPATTITSGPAAGSTTASTSASLGFSSSQTSSTFQCKLDAAAYAACTSPVSYSGLAGGGHTVSVRATDPSGNTDASPATRSWSVDLTAPTTTLASGPSGPTASTLATFTFTTGEAGATFQCSLDGSLFGACTSPRSYSGLGQGAHTFQVRARDAVGNTDATPATRTWTVDTIAPDTLLDSGPTGTTGGSATFTFHSNEAGSSFRCQLDAGVLSLCTSPAPFPGLTSGAHTVAIRAVDAAGNTDATPVSRTWTVDTTAPETTVSSGPPAGSASGQSVSFTFTSDEPGATFECQLDLASFAACSSPKAYAGLAGGPHTFSVRARDAVGNLDASPATRAWTVDATAPDTTIGAGAPSGPVATTAASFAFTANEAGATFECQLDGGAFAACTSPRGYSALGQGAHTFAVRARDAVGNTDATPATRAWVVDTVAPDTAIVSGPSGPTAVADASFGFTGSEPASWFECRIDAGGFAPCTSPHAYVALAQGLHTFAVRARDAAGNVDASPATRTWTVDTLAPQTTLDSGPSGAVAENAATFTFHADDAGATFECRLDAAAFAACVSPRAYNGLTDGTHTFEVRARDATGNTDPTPATRTWRVDLAAPDTTATGPSGAVASNTATVTFSSSEPSSTFECRADGAAYVPCTTPTTYAALAAGPHTVEVRARDAAQNVDPTPAVVSWTVALGLHTPGAVTCAANGLLSAKAPSAYGNDPRADQLVAWRTDFYRFDGAAWQLASSGPVLVGVASPTTPVATWYDTATGLAVGSTAQVTQSRQAVPPGGAWITAHLFFYFTLDGLPQGWDYAVGSSSSGPNAVGNGACSW